MLESIILQGSLQGVTICDDAPSITHTLFVDDSLLLLKINEENAHYLRHILQLYEERSGQAINKDKSSAMFRKNTNDQEIILWTYWRWDKQKNKGST